MKTSASLNGSERSLAILERACAHEESGHLEEVMSFVASAVAAVQSLLRLPLHRRPRLQAGFYWNRCPNSKTAKTTWNGVAMI